MQYNNKPITEPHDELQSQSSNGFDSFKRLSPLSILLRIIEILPQLIIPLYFALTGNWVEISFLLIGSIFGIFIFTSMILRYYYFTYQFKNDEMIIRSGVISKKQRNIPFKRIQNTNVSQNILHRILNLYKLEIETAGDSTGEGILNGISKKHYIEIEELIQKYKSAYKEQAKISESDNKDYENEYDNEKNSNKNSNILFYLDFNGLLKFGIMRFRPLLLPIVGYIYSLFQQYNPNLSENIGNWLELNFGYLFNSINSFQLILTIIMLIFGALLFSWLLDIILTINQFYKFTLFNDEDKLITKRGLLSKRSASIPLKKLQLMRIYTNFIRRKFGYYGLALETAGFGGKVSKGPEVAVPFSRLENIVGLAKNIINFQYPFEFESVSPKTIRRAIFRYLIVSIPILITLSLFYNYMFLIFLLLPVLYWPALIKFRYRMFRIEDDKVIIKQGFIFEKISIIPIEKIQNVIIKETFFQRKLGLSSLIIDTAATPRLNETMIIDINSERAKDIMIDIMNKFNSKN